jgi:methyl-accepting chemotaxis protein
MIRLIKYLLKTMTIRTKLICLIGGIFCIMTGSSFYMIYQKNTTFENGKLEKLETVVNLAYGRLEKLYAKVESGELTLDQVLQEYYAELDDMIFDDGQGYIFVINTNGIVENHAVSPKLEGKNLYNAKDSSGEYFIQKFARLAKTEGQGSIEYDFVNPTTNIVEPKVAYIKYFKPLDTMIGTGVYFGDLRAEQKKFTTVIAIELALIILAVLIIFMIIFIDFRNAMKRLQDNMTQLADNNTDVEIDLSRKDEMGEMAKCVKVFQENAVERQRLKDESESEKNRLEEQSKAKIHEITTDVALSSSLVEEHIYGISTAASELSSTLEDIGGKVDETSNMTMLAQEEAEKGNTTIQELNESAVKIGEVVKLIQEIAEKTNLLALNASIEAARAGEEGRGFAVVAEEVKKLAQQTSNATSDIYSLVNQIQSNSDLSVKSIDNIGKQISSINEFTQMLVVSMSEQRAATNDISERMSHASDGARAVSQRIQEIRE